MPDERWYDEFLSNMGPTWSYAAAFGSLHGSVEAFLRGWATRDELTAHQAKIELARSIYHAKLEKLQDPRAAFSELRHELGTRLGGLPADPPQHRGAVDSGAAAAELPPGEDLHLT